MTYEFDGKKYEKASTHQKEWGDKLISELTLKGNEHILDLGCGDGKLTADLAEFVPNGLVLGIDASQGMIDAAKQKKSNNLQFKLLDINELPLLSDKFDVIFSNATLHWIKNHQKLWENVFSFLNPEGIVRFNFAADGNCSHFLKVIKEAMALDEYKQYFIDFEWPWYMPTLDDYKNILKNYNFSELNIWGQNADRFFPNQELLIEWVNQPSIVPFLKNIDKSKKERFQEFVIKYMVEKTKQNDGRYFETFRRINVFAKK